MQTCGPCEFSHNLNFTCVFCSYISGNCQSMHSFPFILFSHSQVTKPKNYRRLSQCIHLEIMRYSCTARKEILVSGLEIKKITKRCWFSCRGWVIRCKNYDLDIVCTRQSSLPYVLAARLTKLVRMDTIGLHDL